MKNILSVLKWPLLVWGGVSLIAVLWIVGLTIFESLDRTDTVHAYSKEVRYAVNSCYFGEKRIEKVVHSYVGSRGGPGDHLDVLAIQLTEITLEELTSTTDVSLKGRWYRGDQLPKVADDVVAFIAGWLHPMLGKDVIAWFPKEDELRSSGIYAYPCFADYGRVRPYAAMIIFVRPNKMLFFFNGKA